MRYAEVMDLRRSAALGGLLGMVASASLAVVARIAASQTGLVLPFPALLGAGLLGGVAGNLVARGAAGLASRRSARSPYLPFLAALIASFVFGVVSSSLGIVLLRQALFPELPPSGQIPPFIGWAVGCFGAALWISVLELGRAPGMNPAQGTDTGSTR
jgi:hypothetical protein